MSQESDVFFKPEKVVPIPNKDLLSWIFDEPKYDQDKAIYIDVHNSSLSLTAKQCKNLIRRLISGFKSNTKLQAGDCVCVHSFNNVFYSPLFLAVVGAGLVWAGTNPGYTSFELAHHIKTSKAKMIITEPELSKSITDVAAECWIEDANILLFDWQNGIAQHHQTQHADSWRSLLCSGEADWERFDDPTSAQGTACRLYSSGTTGLPKAAAISHYNLVAQHILVHEQVEKPYEISRILCLPFFHAAMVPLAHITPLRAGHVSYVMRRFDLEMFLRCTQERKVTELFLISPIIVAIATSTITEKYSLRSIRWGMAGGAPVDANCLAKLNTLIHPQGRVNVVWGMTECSCLGTTWYWNERDATGSIGRMLPNLEVKMVDDQDKEIRSYNTNGEIWIRGPTIIQSYFENPKADADSFTDGWFHTGDIAYCNKDSKKWYIVDRRKELIKVRGFQVAPPELEGVLMSHLHIVDAAVIGIKANNLVDGESPRAYIVKDASKEAQKLDEETVKSFIAQRLAKYKHLSGGVVFVDSIPKNGTGKILKRILRDLAKKEGVKL